MRSSGRVAAPPDPDLASPPPPTPPRIGRSGSYRGFSVVTGQCRTRWPAPPKPGVGGLCRDGARVPYRPVSAGGCLVVFHQPATITHGTTRRPDWNSRSDAIFGYESIFWNIGRNGTSTATWQTQGTQGLGPNPKWPSQGVSQRQVGLFRLETPGVPTGSCRVSVLRSRAPIKFEASGDELMSPVRFPWSMSAGLAPCGAHES